ncbi:hypothetical protein AcV7_004342 [Taiwanofungus camphoratus]|nr:hypothetical protein AcV7_004342 [Antrodia cinnamomea]
MGCYDIAEHCQLFILSRSGTKRLRRSRHAVKKVDVVLLDVRSNCDSRLDFNHLHKSDLVPSPSGLPHQEASVIVSGGQGSRRHHCRSRLPLQRDFLMAGLSVYGFIHRNCKQHKPNNSEFRLR